MRRLLIALKRRWRLFAATAAGLLVAGVAIAAWIFRNRVGGQVPRLPDELDRALARADQKRAIANMAAGVEVAAARAKDAETQKALGEVMAIEDDRDRLNALIRLRNGQRPGGRS